MPRKTLEKKPGMRFNALVAIEPVQTAEEIEANGNSHVWRWRCDCGETHEAIWHNVAYGRTRSCGCGVFRATSDTGKSRKLGRPPKDDPRYTLEELAWRGTPLSELAKERHTTPRRVLTNILRRGEP